MWALDFATVDAFVQANRDRAAGLAAGLAALTPLAGGLSSRARKDEIALWLMGAQSERNRAMGFTALFDAVFGARHFSWRCVARSALASLVAVALIWLLMGQAGAIGLRLRAELSLGALLAIALAVNVVADYVSLLETR